MEQTSGPKSRSIVLAGGCFWGVEAYFSRIPGVVKTICGYANGNAEAPAYGEVCAGRTGHAEAVMVWYDPERVSLRKLLEQFFRIIDPLCVNRQGIDVGTQYRSGVYFQDEQDAQTAWAAFDAVWQRIGKNLATEPLPLRNFYPAQEHRQKYLEKNPFGYCHIDFSGLSEIVPGPEKRYSKPSADVIRKKLTAEQFHVTQNAGTERPFSGEYWDNTRPGIYVDVVTGEPLFLSSDKFDSGCGWPSFSRPAGPGAVKTREDRSHGMFRTEVRSQSGDSHLGHVFEDGPKDRGGFRCCINRAALRFVPYDEMDREGYGERQEQIRRIMAGGFSVSGMVAKRPEKRYTFKITGGRATG